MNWRRGLSRVWIVLSVLWIAGVLYLEYAEKAFDYAYAGWLPAIVFVPPLSLAIVFAALYWIFAGFFGRSN